MSPNPARFPADPTWRNLLAIGFDRLREFRTYAWFFAASVALSLIGGAAEHAGGLGSVLSLAASLGFMYGTLVLARQLMTGELKRQPEDMQSMLRLIGLGFAIALVLAIPVAIAVVLGLAFSRTAAVGAVLMVALPTTLYLAARTSFYLPALALNRPVTLRQSYAQTRPYWGRLLAVFAAVSVAAAALGTAIFWLPAARELPWLLLRGIDGLVSGAGVLIAESAACYLYWTRIR
jgi:hypothetical protein